MDPANRKAKAQLRSVVSSLEFFLNPKIFENDKTKQQISDHLKNDNLVVIREALQAPVAERMFECLDQFSNWQVYEGYTDDFHYHHHNIYPDNKHFPPDLHWCGELFGTEATRALVQELSGRDCSTANVLSASLYLPGDHSLPHDDSTSPGGVQRQVAFVWHLTKNWQPKWGGALYWCKTNRYIPPSFNSLILFNVGKDSFHHVTTVSPYAQSKRLAISGWWTGNTPVEIAPEVAPDPNSLVELV